MRLSPRLMWSGLLALLVLAYGSELEWLRVGDVQRDLESLTRLVAAAIRRADGTCDKAIRRSAEAYAERFADGTGLTAGWPEAP